MQSDKKRIYMLDELRGFAIICMIIHHLFLDIGDIMRLEWGYRVFDALCIVQPLFWAIFIIISGICSRLSRSTLKRGLIVSACALAVTLVTAVIMPMLNFEGGEIYFGILHCLGVCMIITGLLMPIINKIDYKICAPLSLVLFFFFYGINNRTLFFGLIHLPSAWYKYDFLAPIGLFSEGFKSADYFSILPWIFMFLFGAFVGQLAKEERLPQAMYKKRSGFLCKVGKNSLWIYLFHQPVIYIALLLILFITV